MMHAALPFPSPRHGDGLDPRPRLLLPPGQPPASTLEEAELTTRPWLHAIACPACDLDGRERGQVAALIGLAAELGFRACQPVRRDRAAGGGVALVTWGRPWLT